MKVTSQHNTTSHIAKRRWLKYSLASLLLLVTVTFLLLQLFPERWQQAQTKLQYKVVQWAEQHGYRKVHAALTFGITDEEHLTHIKQLLPASPMLYLQSLAASDLPLLRIDIKFEDMQQLEKKRQQAIKRNYLEASDSDYVPARISLNHKKSLKAKVRLKGDLPEHFDTDKWSMRVKLSGNNSLFHMNKFSLQSPITRDIVGPILFNETLKTQPYSVISPRYFFVRLVVNGDNKGIMAIEEFFAKELIESQQRPESVILKFDETRLWRVKAPQGLFYIVYNNYFNTPITAFGSNKIQNTPTLQKNYETAAGLLRGYLTGKLVAADVFDAKRMGAYLANIDLWGASHAAQWNNMRFYYNPITAKLEPITFDAELGAVLPTKVLLTQSTTELGPLLAANLYKDPNIAHAYQEAGKSFDTALRQHTLQTQLDQLQNQAIQKVGSEFFLFKPFKFNKLAEQAPCLSVNKSICDYQIFKFKLTPEDKFLSIKTALYKHFVNAYHINDHGQHYLELQNMVPPLVEITDIKGFDSNNQPISILPETTKLPITLPATPLNTAGTLVRVPLNNKIPPTTRIVVTAKAIVPNELSELVGELKPLETTAIPMPAILDKTPIPNTPLKTVMANNPFIQLTDNSVTIPSGQWLMQGDLVIPAGYQLKIQADTTIKFSADHGLIARGAIQLHGTKEQPIILTAQDTTKGWKGLAVLSAEQPSHLQYVTVEHTTGISYPRWELRGGVNFYESPVTITHSTFQHNSAEDAVNLIHSEFTFSHNTLSDTGSDGLDIDFSRGLVTNSTFRNIGSRGGGDAIDASGSDITIKHIAVEHASDKGISIGEKSTATITNITINDVNVGVVSKDLSTTVVTGLTLDSAKLAGLMAYIKKPSYGPAKLLAENIKLTNTNTTAIAQNKSVIAINQQKIKTTKLNVEELYQTSMHSEK